MKTKVVLKIVSLVLTVLTGGLGIASAIIDDKKEEMIIDEMVTEKVAEACAKNQ